MPVHLKCKNCGKKYYTARSRKIVNKNMNKMKCEECGAELRLADFKGGDSRKEKQDTKANLDDFFK